MGSACAHRPVEEQPLLVELLIRAHLTHHLGQHAVRPLKRLQIVLAVQVGVRHRLRVDHDRPHELVLADAILRAQTSNQTP